VVVAFATDAPYDDMCGVMLLLLIIHLLSILESKLALFVEWLSWN
jgi:hypothetical protein